METTSVIELLAALAGTVALVVVCGLVARHFVNGAGKPSGDIRIVATTNLGNRDRLIEGARSFSNSLNARGISHMFHETDGAHAWGVWRKHLAEFALRLFVHTSKGSRNTSAN